MMQGASMRAPGLRLQLLLLLGGLLGISFLLLHLALATFTKVTLRRVDESQARALAQLLGAYVTEAAQHQPLPLVMRNLEQRGAASGLLAARLTLNATALQAEFGDAIMLGLVAQSSRAELDNPFQLAGTPLVLGVELPLPAGSLLLALNAEQSSARGAALINSFRLYASLIAGSLLIVVYLALTRLIVRPLDDLEEAAH